MEYIKTYIILYKSNTRVIYFSYMLKPHFYFDRLLWSFCVYTVWYDASFLKWNGKILMKWLSQPASVCVHVFM